LFEEYPMKKVLGILLIAVALTSVVGCSEETKTTPKASTPAAAPKTSGK
jgi:hypothetical protein